MPVVEVALLRSVRVFEVLGATALEDLARRLIPVPVRAGERVIEEGRPGRRYYVVAHGSLEITRGASRPVATLGRGEGIGEISLLAGLPCTATATAGEAGLLYALDAEPFIEVMNDHAASAMAFTRRVLATRQNPSTTPEHTRARSAHRPPEFHGPQPFARHPPREAAVGWGHSRDWPQRPS